MNHKLLKELSKSADTECGWSEERFARLIIEECANVAADHDALDIYEEIREHFGVNHQ